MFTLYTINSKSYYLPVKDIPSVTDARCVEKTTSDGRVIHVLREELPGFLKTVFDELHLYSFDQLKYEIDPHRIHNRLSTFLTLPPDILRKIISYMCPYETLLAVTCQKFRNMVLNSRLSMWTAAANAGDLKLLLALKPKPAQIQTICESTLNGSRATEEDRLNILEYFYNQKKYDLKKLPLEKAAANGDLKILQWALKRMSTFFSKAQLSKDVVFAAIKNGHLPILIWAESEGFRFYGDSFGVTVMHGHLDIIEWMHKKGLSTRVVHSASLYGHLHILEWGYKNGYNQLNSRVLENGAALNRLDIMQWAYERGAPLPPDLCETAAFYGHLEALEWAHNNKLTLGKTGAIAAAKGYLKILQWTEDQGEKIDEKIFRAAAASGQLAVLQWVRSKNVQLDVTICHIAALAGHLHILQWARENGIPWNNKTICRTAVESKNLELMMWVKAAGAEWHWDIVIEKAMKCGLVTVLQWAKESGAPMNLDAIYESALIDDQERVIHWLIQNGLDRDKGQRALLAIKASLGE
jgi:hypothetical protein